MPDIDYTRLSKTISHALRHAPSLYKLQLDEQGWTPVTDLLNGLRRHGRAWRTLTEADIQAVIARPGKKRFEISEGKIRALYGHSTKTKVYKEPAEPPTLLYHGTTPRSAVLIQEEGLKPMNRQYVHLSADQHTAAEVGRRRTPIPVILQIQAAEAHAAGLHFYHGNGLIWLANAIPPQFIREVTEHD